MTGDERHRLRIAKGSCGRMPESDPSISCFDPSATVARPGRRVPFAAWAVIGVDASVGLRPPE